MVRVDSRDSGTSGYVTMSAVVSSGSDEWLLNVTSGSSSFRNRGILIIVRNESLDSSGGDDTMSVEVSASGSWLVLSVASDSGRNTEGYVLLIGGRGRSAKRESVNILLNISSTISSE